MKTGVKSTSAAGVSPSGTGKCSVLSVKKAARNLRRRRSRSRPCSKHRLAGPEDEPTTFSFSISSSSSPPAPSSGDSSDTDAAPGRWRRPGGESGDRGSHGAVSAMGRTRVMEDAVSVEPMFISGYDFFGVYDGHGGSRVSQACRVGLHRMLAEDIRGGGGEGVDWGKAMAACFRKMDDEVCGGGGAQKGPAAETVKTVGSTAVVAVVGEEVVVVANCGDSRAVLCRRGVAVPLSNDHKPGRVDELRRIEAAGGKVINWNGDRVLGVLATSRSIGDQYLKPFVTSEPEVTVTERDDGVEFLVLASDGLWDVVSNEVACKVVRRSLYGSTGRTTQLGFLSGNGIETQNDGRASEAAAVLAALAIARGSKDNISVIVIELRKPRWSGLASMRS